MARTCTLSSKCTHSCSVGCLSVGETAFSATVLRGGEGVACEATEPVGGKEGGKALAAIVPHGGEGDEAFTAVAPLGDGGVALAAAAVPRDGGEEGHVAFAASGLPCSSARRARRRQRDGPGCRGSACPALLLRGRG